MISETLNNSQRNTIIESLTLMIEQQKEIIDQQQQTINDKDKTIDELKQQIKTLKDSMSTYTKEEIAHMEELRKSAIYDYPEIWKPFVNVVDKETNKVFNCPDYEVSNYGRYRNIKKKKEIGKIQKDGYVHLTFYDVNNKSINKCGHQITALMFNQDERKPGDTVVNHRNHNRWDNSYKNLEWTTTEENNKDKGYANGKRNEIINELPEGFRKIDTVKTTQSIWEFDDLYYVNGKFWITQKGQYKELFVNNGNINAKPKNKERSIPLSVKTIKTQYNIE